MPRGQKLLTGVALGLAGLALLTATFNLISGHSDHVWSVIVRCEATRDAARAASERINRTIYGFRAEVVEPHRGRSAWCVVIGEGLTHADAERLKAQAVGAGLVDAELWTPPSPK